MTPIYALMKFITGIKEIGEEGHDLTFMNKDGYFHICISKGIVNI